ncbi:MAG: hypothetical protein KQH63_00305 [Desulfobulbaceae bacterium]|nr:hypothetical protein [Desulfobulbaceae bacterium]
MTAQLALKSKKKHPPEVAEVQKKRVRSVPMKKKKTRRTQTLKKKNMMNQPAPVAEAALSSSTVRAAKKDLKGMIALQVHIFLWGTWSVAFLSPSRESLLSRIKDCS